MDREDRLRARRENRALFRFIAAFFMSCAFGAIGFFAIWTLKDAVPALLRALFPPEAQQNPNQLITYATMFVAGIAWLAAFLSLWFSLERTEHLSKRLLKLAIWCACAGLIWLAGEGMLLIAIRLSL
jgi:hypothetical protein